MANTAREPKAKQHPEMQNLTGEEQKSVTHGEFWIPEAERQVYQRALRKLNEDGVKYVVSGLYALYEYTGIYRKTKDLDLFVEPGHVVTAARSLKEAGFNVYLEQSHWIAKAMWEDKQTDLIYGMGNGVSFIDELWYKRSRPGILAATPVRRHVAEQKQNVRLLVYLREHLAEVGAARRIEMKIAYCRDADISSVTHCAFPLDGVPRHRSSRSLSRSAGASPREPDLCADRRNPIRAHRS